jgi:YhgE/Pip-like protein
MFKKTFQNKETWIMPVVIGLGIALITFFLLGAFLSPTENTHNLPIALVNGDKGVTAGTQPMNFGAEISNRLTAPQPTDTLKWTVVDSRESALQGVRQNKYYVAVVIPEDYSASLMAIAGQKATQPARIEMLVNPVVPAMGGQLAQGIVQNILGSISKTTGEQLTAQVRAMNVPVALPAATFLDNPVQITTVPVATIGDHSGRGVNVMFLAILLIIAGLLSAVLANRIVQEFTTERQKEGKSANAWATFGAQITLNTLAVSGAVTGLLLTAWALNMDVANWLNLTLFSFLVALTVNWFVLMCQMTMSKAALPVASLFLILLGLPSSGALFPVESLPTLWQWLNAVVPMRYMVDGLRSILFLNAEMQNGLGNALIVLPAYALGALAIAGLAVWAISSRPNRKTSEEKPLKPIAA